MMRRVIGVIVSMVGLALCAPARAAQGAAAASHGGSPEWAERSDALSAMARAAVRSAIEQRPAEKVEEQDVAVTIVDLHDPQHPSWGSFRGDAPIYPASVVKLFYLVATQQWLADGKLQDSPELRRTMHDMIVDSSNDATASILVSVTDAPGGAPLPEEQMKAWSEKRNAVNRYFAGLGFTGINVCQKTYCEGPYGRERIFLGEKFENRNKLTTDATARLLAEIALRRAVDGDAKRCGQMLELLSRDWSSPARANDPDDQAHGFTALAGLPQGTKLWSKAGWTNTARHDAAYLELPDGRKMVVVTFTTGHAKDRQLVPSVAKYVMEHLR